MRCGAGNIDPDEGRDILTNGLASLEYRGRDSAEVAFIEDMDKLQEIGKLHETMYELGLIFLALRTRPGCEARLAEIRKQIIRIYGRIRSMA